jgi:hypothetical protein
MTDAQHEWERRAIILLGGGLAYIVTCAIIVLAFMADNEGERNLLIGGLLSSPVFGAAALFALLGITRQLTAQQRHRQHGHATAADSPGGRRRQRGTVSCASRPVHLARLAGRASR